ncbi:hypothetical protein CPA45_05605 [Vreelandella nigrificans]|uniref:Uncharacterized protein n=1 Tax=Vreelandella nigrificans TaxID=2042704 RepID=A0A2A4HQ34_9GAMM|nr:hypothetical protein CPA45_05605 [Halomonas nigrificans]
MATPLAKSIGIDLWQNSLVEPFGRASKGQGKRSGKGSGKKLLDKSFEAEKRGRFHHEVMWALRKNRKTLLGLDCWL